MPHSLSIVRMYLETRHIGYAIRPSGEREVLQKEIAQTSLVRPTELALSKAHRLAIGTDFDFRSEQ